MRKSIIKNKSTNNITIIFAPLLLIILTSISVRMSYISKEINTSHQTFNSLEKIVEELKQDNVQEIYLLLNKYPIFLISFPENNEDANQRFISLEGSIRFLFAFALELRKKKNMETALLFERTAYQLISQSKQVHDSRPWLEESLRKLPAFAEKYETKLARQNREKTKRVQ